MSITYKKDYDRGIAEAERAVALEPGSAEAYGQLAMHLSWAGRSAEALSFYNKAFRLSPFPAPRWVFNLANDYMKLGRYEEAIAILKRLIQKHPDQLFAHTGLAAAYMLSGRAEEAKAEAAEVLRIDPNFSLERTYRNLPFRDQEELNRRKEALRQTGLK